MILTLNIDNLLRLYNGPLPRVGKITAYLFYINLPSTLEVTQATLFNSLESYGTGQWQKDWLGSPIRWVNLESRITGATRLRYNMAVPRLFQTLFRYATVFNITIDSHVPR